MLQPTNRLTLIDAMRPPPLYRFDAALAVTFTLDLAALLAAPAAFAFAAHDLGRAGETTQEPIELLHAVRSYSDRITVFSQCGFISLPPSRRVFSFLERSIIEVRAPRGGIVHPKVWLLRYVADVDADEADPESVMRVLISSRNLTFDESWDTMIRLDEIAGPGGVQIDAISALFEGLSLESIQPLRRVEADRVADLTADLRTRRFALPEGIDHLDVHVLGLDDPEPLFPATIERSMVMSPFVTDYFFDSISPGPTDILVSRQESLDALAPETRSRVGEIFTFDDQSSSEDDAEPAGTTAEDPGRRMRGLHAKVFAFEGDGRAHVFLGSANATTAAFGNNVEILVELHAPADVLGIDRLIDGTDDEMGLRKLLVNYTSRETEEADVDPGAIDAARRALAALEIRGVVEPSGDEWAVTYRSQKSIVEDPELSVWCWPLSTQGNRREVSIGEPLDVRFETSIDAISGFLAFEVQSTNGLMTQFVVPVPLDGVPDERDRALMKSLIGNAERFFGYLLAILEDGSTETQDTRRIAERLGADHDDPSAAMPVLEKLLRTLRREPERLNGLHPLVVDLARDDVLPDGFTELWQLLIDTAEMRVEP